MGESTKAVCALVILVGIISSLLAWGVDRPDAATWGFRVGGPVVAMLALAAILKLHFRPDKERDYLRAITGNYFNRDGFCFSCIAANAEGVAVMTVYFQTQYDRPSIGRIALRPARDFFLTRAKIETILCEVDCPSGGFGVARIAFPVPENRQGKKQSFEVGASVRYPDGKGRRIRFHDGVFLRSNTNFGDSFGVALTVMAATSGAIVLSKPATAVVELPLGVKSEIPDHLGPDTEILWMCGDVPLKQAAYNVSKPR